MAPINDLAVLKAKIQIKNKIVPPGCGRNRPKTSDFLKKMAVRTLPRDPPGEGGAKNKIKKHFKHSQDESRYQRASKLMHKSSAAQ